jgi:hypothetical protein
LNGTIYFRSPCLKTEGITDQRDYNQIANFAVVEWGDNTAVSGKPPSEYVPTFEARFDARLSFFRRCIGIMRCLSAGMAWPTMHFW